MRLKFEMAIISFSVVISFVGYGSEVDSFTNRYQNLVTLRDDIDVINDQINYYIDLALEKSNTQSSSQCLDVKGVVENARKFLGAHWRSQTGAGYYKENNLYRWLKYDGPISRNYTGVKNSVYRDFTIFESPSLAGVSMFHDTMGALLKHGNIIVGSDKYTHFFNRGKKYWKNYYGLGKESRMIRSEKQRERYMLDMGNYSEESLFGSKSTGVASFGDLAANFQGMRFWNKFAGTGADIVTGIVPSPYIQCQANKWVQIERVDMRDWVNASWDEALNCSKYKNAIMANKVKKRIDQLKRNDPTRLYECPVDMLKIWSTKQVFGRFYEELVNVAPYDFIPESKQSWKEPNYKDYMDKEDQKLLESHHNLGNVVNDNYDPDDDEIEDD